MRKIFIMEIPRLVPDRMPTSTISQEESTDNLSQGRSNHNMSNTTESTRRSTATQTSYDNATTSLSPQLLETVRSIEQLIRSKFGELNRTLTRHCNRTQQVLRHIRLRIDAYLRPQRSSIQRRTGTRSSRLPIQRPQYHLRSVAQRASTFRIQRRGSHRIGPQRSMAPRIAGQMPSVIHRRSVSSRPPQPHNNPGVSGRGSMSRTLRNAIQPLRVNNA